MAAPNDATCCPTADRLRPGGAVSSYAAAAIDSNHSGILSKLDGQAVLLRLQSSNCRTAAALALTVIGWSLIWVNGLALFDGVLLWFSITTFVLGLALIPFRRARGSEPD